jgi:uncharacterized membrane protein
MAPQQATELMIILFESAERAAQAAEVFAELNREHVVDLRNAAIITRDGDGRITIHETNDPTTGEGTLLGALIGGLLGYLKERPVQGAAIGAAGGYLATRMLDLGFEDTTLRAIAHNLTPDASSLVLAVSIHDPDAAAQRLAPLGGKVLHDGSLATQASRFALALGQGVVEGSIAPSSPTA